MTYEEAKKELNDESTDEYFEYLDNLRENAETNMFGATPYLQEEFGLEKRYARKVLSCWMETFRERQLAHLKGE